MAGFVYFFPHELGVVEQGGKLNHAKLQQLRLGATFLDVEVLSNDVAVSNSGDGPLGLGRGTTVYLLGNDKKVPANLSSDIRWFARKGWAIGALRGGEPMPADLLRPRIIPGGMLTDGNDREWSVPICRAPDVDSERHTLPVDLGYDEDFNLQGAISVRYAHYWDLAGEVLELCRRLWRIWVEQQEEGKQETEDDPFVEERGKEWQAETAITFLGINYRFGPNEFAALKELKAGLTLEFCFDVLRHVSDFGYAIQFMSEPEPQDDEKKNAMGLHARPADGGDEDMAEGIIADPPAVAG